jgi:carboxylesterase type B
MFGEALKPGQNYSQEDRELSRMMMTYWTNFAKTGSECNFYHFILREKILFSDSIV